MDNFSNCSITMKNNAHRHSFKPNVKRTKNLVQSNVESYDIFKELILLPFGSVNSMFVKDFMTDPIVHFLKS